MKNFILLFLGLSFFASNTIAQQFKINGTGEGFSEGTWLYLSNEKAIKLDSAQVKNNKFSLSGKINGPAEAVVLHTVKRAEYAGFWIEPKTMELAISLEEFKKAKLKGSATQDESERLFQIIAPLRKKRDSLSALMRTGKNNSQMLLKDYKAIGDQEKEFFQTYVKENPNQFMAIQILGIYAPAWGKERVAELYKNLNINLKGSIYGKEISNFLDLNQTIKIGTKYVDFEQPNTVGKLIKLSAIKARYILLDFWASWCGPCRGENPNLVKTYLTYKPKGFEILGVSADNNKDAWLKAIKDDQLPWENVSDLKGDQNVASLIYGVHSFPTNYLIDQNGIIVAKDVRGDELQRKLAELMP